MQRLKSLTARIGRLEANRPPPPVQVHYVIRRPGESEEQAVAGYTHETGKSVSPDDFLIVYRIVD